MQDPKETDPKQTSSSGTGVLLRLYWLILGNALLFFVLVFIFERHPKLPSLLDVAFVATMASLLIVRYIDIRFFDGQTGEGKPATMQDWRGYGILVGAVGTGGWLLARGLAHFIR